MTGLFALLLTVNAPCAVFDTDTFSDGDFSITAQKSAGAGPTVWATSDNTGSMIGGDRRVELSSTFGDTFASVSGGVLTLPRQINGAGAIHEFRMHYGDGDQVVNFPIGNPFHLNAQALGLDTFEITVSEVPTTLSTFNINFFIRSGSSGFRDDGTFLITAPGTYYHLLGSGSSGNGFNPADITGISIAASILSSENSGPDTFKFDSIQFTDHAAVPEPTGFSGIFAAACGAFALVLKFRRHQRPSGHE